MTTTGQASVPRVAAAMHELRNALTLLGVHVAVAAASAESGDLAATSSAARRAETVFARVPALLDDVTHAARRRDMWTPREVRRFDLGDAARGIVDSYGALADVRGVALTANVASVVPVVGDAFRLEQVLANLTENAVKYSRPLGRVEVTVRVDGEDAVVAVRDEGVGLDADELESVFAPATRGRETIGAAGQGWGLFIARAIAERHAGGLTASSAGRDRGATFTLRLPLAPRVGAYHTRTV